MLLWQWVGGQLCNRKRENESTSTPGIPPISGDFTMYASERLRQTANSSDFVRSCAEGLGGNCRGCHAAPMHLSISRRQNAIARLASTFPLALGIAAAIAPNAGAQYSDNSASPLPVFATSSDDVQPKLAPAPNDGHYVSFLSGSGYDVMVTRLDKNGNAVWAAPVVVEDRAQSSTTDYGLASDAAGNVYLAYDHPNVSTPAIRVKSLDPQGNTRWSQVVTALSGVNVGRVTVASDGAVWVAHALNATPRIQRFDAATGAPTFATPITITESGATQIPADIQPSVDGAVIVSCVRYVTFTGAKVLRAHRINADGTRPWPAIGAQVFTTGSLQFGNFPSFIADGAGGAYFAWYGTSPLQSYVQRVDASGAVLYGTSGIAVTSTAGDNRVSPSMTLGADGRLYVFWSQQTPNTSIYGVFGQCFAKGVRQWGAGGVAIEPMSSTFSRSWATAGRVGDGIVCFYADSSSAVQDTIRVRRVATTGAVEWSTDVAVTPGVKYRLAAVPAASNGCVLAWQGGASTGASDIFAARVGEDGTLGQPPAGNPADLNGDGVVNAADLAALLSQWGAKGGSADLDASGSVGASDLAILLSSWSA